MGKIPYIQVYLVFAFFTVYLFIAIQIGELSNSNVYAERYKNYGITTGEVTEGTYGTRAKEGKFCTYSYTVDDKKWFSRGACSYIDATGSSVPVFYNKSFPGRYPTLIVPEYEDISNLKNFFWVQNILLIIMAFLYLRSAIKPKKVKS